MLELRRLQIRHAKASPLFAPLDLRIDPGQVGIVMGPSGVGKSTLLDAIGGHLARDFTVDGDILLDGSHLAGQSPQARRIGVIFQDPVLFPHLSVGQNLSFGIPRAIRNRRDLVEKALSDAGMAGMSDRDPATLSGGQMARVALMRGLLARPRALLLDEPFSKLDATLRSDIRAFTFAHVAKAGIPALLVTHDPQDADAARGPKVLLGA